MAQTETLQVVCGFCSATNRVPRTRLDEHPSCGRCKRPLFRGEPVELTAAAFEASVRHSDIPLRVDFWAAWCGPCRMMAPVVAQAARRLQPRVRVAKLDTEAAPELAARLAIRSIPTLILFAGGRELARHSGAVDLGTLERWVEAKLGRAAA